MRKAYCSAKNEYLRSGYPKLDSVITPVPVENLHPLDAIDAILNQ